MKSKRNSGFTLLELLIASAAGLILVGGAAVVLRQGYQLNTILAEKSELQQNARVALNLLSRDLSLAGTGFPQGGIQLPSGPSAGNSYFACDGSQCYVSSNTYIDERLYGLRPADQAGAPVNGQNTDVVTIVYRDPELALDEYPLTSISADGTSITFHSGSASAAAEIEVGDVICLCTVNGCAATTVTGQSGTTVSLSGGDALGMNQPSAEVGNVASLAAPAPPSGVYPPTTAVKLQVITYYVEGTTRQLMRQVSAHSPVAVAENVEDLQFTYDVYDTTSSTATSALGDAGGSPNQVRKANIEIRVRAPRKTIFRKKFHRLALATSVSTRNLTFRDRYN